MACLSCSRAFNFASTIASGVVSGQLRASEKTTEARKAICSACPHRSGRRCKDCGCFIDFKARWAVSSCGLGRWGPEADR